MLGVSLIDLLVPADLDDDQPYRLAPNRWAKADAVRDWFRGDAFLLTYKDGTQALYDPKGPPAAADIAAFIQWMPDGRGREVMQRWLEERQREEELQRQEEEDR